MNAPEKLQPVTFKDHGPAASLVRKYERRSRLWAVAFFSLLLFYLLTVLLSTIKSQPVIAVDESGRVLGTMEYMDPDNRTNNELVASSRYFIRNFININSKTIFDDYAEALNMMDKAFYKEALKGVTEDNYLARIRDAKSSSFLEWGKDINSSIVFNRKGNSASVRLKGNIVIISGKSDKRIPFDTTVDLVMVRRSTLSTHGILITGVKDN